MNLEQLRHRPLPEMAREILEERVKRLPPDVRASMRALAELRAVDDEAAYRTVATARISMNVLRSPAAKRVKYELETILSRYRAERWPE